MAQAEVQCQPGSISSCTTTNCCTPACSTSCGLPEHLEAMLTSAGCTALLMEAGKLAHRPQTVPAGAIVALLTAHLATLERE